MNERERKKKAKRYHHITLSKSTVSDFFSADKTLYYENVNILLTVHYTIVTKKNFFRYIKWKLKIGQAKLQRRYC